MPGKFGQINTHILAKPTGAKCNLDCKYCFYKEKTTLYPKSSFKMSYEVQREYIKQYVQSVPTPVVTWQGGEPLLMGIEFYERSLEEERRFKQGWQQVENAIQTNGTLITEAWAEFFQRNGFLVGLSLDGPEELHDEYRVDKVGRPTFEKVETAAWLLGEYRVNLNVLCTVNAANVEHPLDVYRFLRDVIGTEFIQFIPIVGGDYGIDGKQWGEFLTTVFDEWVVRDKGKTFVQHFDNALGAWLGRGSSVCVFAHRCGDALALEHNGDLYACDHYVDEGHLLGNIMETDLLELVPKNLGFGLQKFTTLPKYCMRCPALFACQGECPKNRTDKTPDGESGLNHLCEGYRRFFAHIDKPMMEMAVQVLKGSTQREAMRETAL